MQATAVTQATTATPATGNINDDSNIMTAHNSRTASSSRNVSNNRTTNTGWTQSKAGMLAKTLKPATAWRVANSSRDNRNITASTAEGRPGTVRMPTRNSKDARNSTSISRDANSTIWTPTIHEFSRKFAERRKTRGEIRKKRKKFPIFCTRDFSNSDSYRTIGSPM